jgi:hypothetical protein
VAGRFLGRRGNYGNRPEPIPFLHILAVSDHDVRGERGPLT